MPQAASAPGPAGNTEASAAAEATKPAEQHEAAGQAFRRAETEAAGGPAAVPAAPAAHAESAPLPLAPVPRIAEGTPASAAAATGGSAPAAPAAQLAPVLVAMSADKPGNQQLVVQLAPEELGRVEIRIERVQDGPANVQVTAERPETLQLLQHDAPALQRTLDQAGFAQEGRTLSFHLGAPDNPPAAANGSGTGWTGAGQGEAGYRQNENQPGRQPGPQGQAFRAAAGFAPAEVAIPAAAFTATTAPRLRAGINITA